MTYIDSQFQFFLENQAQLVKDYEGKILVIQDGRVAKAFDSNLDAYLYGKKRFGQGKFLLQKCVAGPAAYTAKVSSFRIKP